MMVAAPPPAPASPSKVRMAVSSAQKHLETSQSPSSRSFLPQVLMHHSLVGLSGSAGSKFPCSAMHVDGSPPSGRANWSGFSLTPFGSSVPGAWLGLGLGVGLGLWLGLGLG